jgi:hypothetical protein
MAADEELTVEEAADLLNGSVAYVRQLLEGGDLRSLERTHVADYREIDRARRLAAVDALASEAQELGLY